MNLSLRARFFLASALVALAALAAVTWLVARQQREWLLARHQEALERTASALARDLPKASGSWPAIAHAWGGTVGLRVTLMNSDGRVIGDSDVPAEGLVRVENHRTRPEMVAALAGHTGHAVRRSRRVGIGFLYVAVPAAWDSVAVLRVAGPLTAIATLCSSLLRLSFGAAALALLLALALAFWLAGRHAGRIGELETVAAAV